MNVSDAANLDIQPDRVKMGSYSMFSLSQMNGLIYEQSKAELRYPQNSKVYKQMQLDSSVATPFSVVEILVGRPEWKIKAPKDAPEEEHSRAKMLNYNLHMMERPWAEYISEMISYPLYGHWEGEKIFRKYSTPHGDFIGCSDIQTISQDTVAKWLIDVDTKKLKGLRQDLTYIQRSSTTSTNKSSYVDIPRIKFIHIKNNPKRNNPEGKSILDACYVDWKYKSLAEEYQIIGVVKDSSGIPMLYVDAERLANAAEDPTSPDGLLVEQLKSQSSAIHAGDLSAGIMPLQYDESGKPLFDIKLLGVEGGGKMYDSLAIAKYHSHKILMTFLMDILSLGEDGGGSFALSDSKLTLVGLAIESHLKTIKRALDHDLIKHLYIANGWEYNPETSARFEYSKEDDGDLTVIAGAIQKVMAVGAVRPSKELEDWLLDTIADLEPYDDNTEFLATENVSGSGEGLEEGLPNGTGKSTAKGGDRSTANVSKDTM